MDLNTGLTQTLGDGTNTYLYGNGRLVQVNTGTEYFLGDALGSVRQLTNANGAVTYASAYDPYGVATQAYGASQTMYGFTGEYTSNDLVYLRARHYVSNTGRFLTRDTWEGNYNRPLSLNRWAYVEGNPANYIDPSGHFTDNAIKSYLMNTYRRDWELYWNAWSADVKWINMLHKAMANDVLFGDHWAVRFEGVGSNVLWGISTSDFIQPINLNDIFKGLYHERYITNRPMNAIPPAYGGTWMPDHIWMATEFYPIEWVSFYRIGERGKPCFYVYPGLEYKETQQSASWAVDTFDYAVGGLAGSVGGPPGVVLGMLVSVYLKPSDVLNVQMNDRNVQVGPVKFNFQLQPDNDTWILENGPH